MKLCTCTGHCRGTVGLGEGWVCSVEFYRQQAADERVAWRCECGAIADVTQPRCERCGSSQPLELR